MSKAQRIISWISRIVVAVILLQTLFFKFTAAPESIFIFEQLGAEPWGRIATGVLELIASVLILLPATVGWGALLSAGLMGGALMSHVTVLGIEVQGDGGTLFILGAVVLIASLITLYLHRSSLPLIGGRS